jgi:hypothetical protein
MTFFDLKIGVIILNHPSLGGTSSLKKRREDVIGQVKRG